MATSKGTKIFLIVGGIVIALFLVGLIGLFLLADTLARPSVPENAVLVLSVSGALPDYVPEDELGNGSLRRFEAFDRTLYPNETPSFSRGNMFCT